MTYYQRLHPLKTGADDPSQGPQKAKVEADSFLTYASIEYELYVQNDSQLYVNLPSLEFENEDYTDVEIITNGQVNRYTTDNVFPFFTIGHFTAGETVKVRIAFPEKFYSNLPNSRIFLL